ncbi:4'-phosphopantetheinyl transferase superfamily protein [Cupriavidus sp. UYPR2.512]|uniref:4'-phosphopantetheinyl transferase family protein n=1 Tax=Cupriavidus sp. UYPR2.512 TaxID=1080187 RepID=UPI0003A7C986|nr:4'-phosphopantetheinyl transferase superfamily protein [Cupriavidus sp. UYPR2.512]
MNRFEHEYEIGTHGKPSLPPQFSASNLEFSLAHADEIALIAVSNLGAVGIDVEREVDSFNVHELAVSVFDRQECQLLANFSAGAAKRGFFRMWVRKEAYAKACGLGLSAGLKVPVLDPTALDDVGRVQIRHAGGKTWLEWAVTSQPGYSAALYQRVDDMARTAHVVPEIREWRLSHLERT